MIHILPVNILEMVIYKWLKITQKFQLPSNIKSYMGFRLAYRHLTLTTSKGQGQGHVHFDDEYIGHIG